MARIVSIVEVPMNAFFKSALQHNDSSLYRLRKQAARKDGFFLIEETDLDSYEDTFLLTGKYQGTWRLGRIRTTPALETDYLVEIYRSNKGSVPSLENGTTIVCRPMDDGQLATTLRKLAADDDLESYTASWAVEVSNTFYHRGFSLT